ncbi:MAG: ribose-phosphate diphosphokinase [Candidatus Absconditabacterales bacterium]
MKEKLHIIGTQDTKHLVNSIITILQSDSQDTISCEYVEYQEFANGEIKVVLDKSVRGKHVYVIGDVNGIQNIGNYNIKYNDRFMQFLLILQCAKNHGAKTVNIIPTCFPYSRQDKPIQGGLKERVSREPSSAQFVIDIFQDLLGADYCITIDVHNPAVINNSRKTNFVNLYTGWFVQQVIRNLKKDNIVLSSMDEGGLKKVSSISKDIGLDYLTVLKKRDYSNPNTVDEMFVHGDVQGKNIIIHDDILDTGGSLIKLIEELNKRNPQSINVTITHGMSNKDSVAKLTKLYDEGKFENIYITNTIYREIYPPFVKIIDVAPIFADAIKNIFMGGSINYNFGVNLSPKNQ